MPAPFPNHPTQAQIVRTLLRAWSWRLLVGLPGGQTVWRWLSGRPAVSRPDRSNERRLHGTGRHTTFPARRRRVFLELP